MDARPEVIATLPQFPSDDGGMKRELMAKFDALETLPETVKEDLRTRVWERLDELARSAFEAHIVPWWYFNLDEYIVIVGLSSSFLLSIGLAFYWSLGQSWVPIALAIGVAAGLAALILGLITKALDWFFSEAVSAGFLFVLVALMVLAIRLLPQTESILKHWLFTGLRAGLWGALAIPVVAMLVTFALPLVERIVKKRWRHPQANLVANLIELLFHLESLKSIEKQREQQILKIIAEASKVEELVRRHTAKTQPPADIFFPDTSEYDREASAVEQIDQKWLELRKLIRLNIDESAKYVERGLTTLLRLGESDADEWIKTELQCRALAMRAWVRQIALPSHENRTQMLGEVASAIEHAAKEDWCALRRSDIPPEAGPWHRMWKFVRKALVGALPLSLVIIAPRLGVEIPDALNGALLTFAIPWLGLQLLELAVPDASDHLSRAKGLREFLPKPS